MTIGWAVQPLLLIRQWRRIMMATDSNRPSEGSAGLAALLEENNSTGSGVITANCQPASEFARRIERGFKTDFLGRNDSFRCENSEVPEDVLQIVNEGEASFFRESDFKQDTKFNSILDCLLPPLNLDAPSFWYDRRVKAERIGTRGILSELDFTVEVLTRYKKNKYAWFQRQWAIKRIGGWEKELAFCDSFIKADITNEPAWDQRIFVVMECGLQFTDVEYATEYILVNPTVEYPWLHLKRIYNVIKDDAELKIKTDGALEDLFCSVLPIESGFGDGPEALFGRDYREIRIITNGSVLRFALATLLDLVYFGYEPTYELIHAVRGLHFSDDYVGFFEAICDILIFLCPLKYHYWKWLSSEIDQIYFERRERM